MSSFQFFVGLWARKCFGDTTAVDPEERRNRFMEEAIELYQACGGSKTDIIELMEYVYARPTGAKAQEVGGVMVTLAALCNAEHVSMDNAAETELHRINGKISQIRAKHLTKPRKSPLPGDYPKCTVPPPGWYCTREVGHEGPCAAWPEQ